MGISKSALRSDKELLQNSLAIQCPVCIVWWSGALFDLLTSSLPTTARIATTAVECTVNYFALGWPSCQYYSFSNHCVAQAILAFVGISSTRFQDGRWMAVTM
jgi:hypothetical protein